MGNGCSTSKKPVIPLKKDSKESSISNSFRDRQTSWKVMLSPEQAKEQFTRDGTLNPSDSDPGHLELRSMLEDPTAQNALGKFAEKIHVVDFMCWIDIQEFKAIPTDNYRRSKALHIYHKYIDASAVLSIGGIADSDRLTLKEAIDSSKTNTTILIPSFYDKVQAVCFLQIYTNIYIPLKRTPEYKKLIKDLQNLYNRVKLDDFEYFSKLGEGGFGFVVHCKKISTGNHYAMKIQTKVGLLRQFKHELQKIDYEKKAFSLLQHPFIVNMDYAFHTDSLAIMVLGLSTGGDLKDCLESSLMGRLSEERVRFYAAEVVLALSYIHSMGMMYRDLKPQNILLNADGHIMLADLGGVIDERGLGFDDELTIGVPLFANLKPAIKEEVGKKEEDGKKVREENELGVMGTFGYMAPEMVVMLNKRKKPISYDVDAVTPRNDDKGYTKAVDWWSLGATIYRLLSGDRPFDESQWTQFENVCSMMLMQDDKGQYYKQYAVLFQDVVYPRYFSQEAVDLIGKFLDVNDKTRLGSGPTGDEDIKAHPFFKGIDWDKLEQKHVEPPYLPVNALDVFNDDSSDLNTLLKMYGKDDWLNEVPRQDLQKHFDSWNFTSAHTIRVESGLSGAMEQYDKNFKVRRLIGDELSVRASESPLKANDNVRRASLTKSK